MYNIVSAVIYVWLPVVGGRKNIAKARQNNNGGGRGRPDGWGALAPSQPKLKTKLNQISLQLQKLVETHLTATGCCLDNWKKKQKNLLVLPNTFLLCHILFSQKTPKRPTQPCDINNTLMGRKSHDLTLTSAPESARRQVKGFVNCGFITSWKEQTATQLCSALARRRHQANSFSSQKQRWNRC